MLCIIIYYTIRGHCYVFQVIFVYYIKKNISLYTVEGIKLLLLVKINLYIYINIYLYERRRKKTYNIINGSKCHCVPIHI